MLRHLSGGIKPDAGSVGCGLGSPSRPRLWGQGLDLAMGVDMDYDGSKEEARKVSYCSVYLPTCSSHLFIACVLLPHAYGYPLPYDACLPLLPPMRRPSG